MSLESINYMLRPTFLFIRIASIAALNFHMQKQMLVDANVRASAMCASRSNPIDCDVLSCRGLLASRRPAFSELSPKTTKRVNVGPFAVGLQWIKRDSDQISCLTA